MNFSTILLALLYLAMIYLHIRQSRLIFQHDIKIAKTLAFVLLIVIAVRHVVVLPLPPELVLVKTIADNIISWTLMLLIYWRVLAGCYKDAYFRKIETPNTARRQNIKAVLSEAIRQNKRTEDFKLLVKTHFDEPSLEAVRAACETMKGNQPDTFSEPFTDEQLAKLRVLVQRLG